MRKQIKKVAAMTMAAAMIGCISLTQAYGYGEVTGSSTLISDTQGTSAYQNWKTTVWDSGERADSGKIVLTPGETEKDLNFAWYSETATGVKLKLSKNSDMSNAKTYDGTSTAIDKENVQGSTYTSSNKVSIVGDIEADTDYYYQYSSDNGATWSATYTYSSQSSDSFSVILVGDPQVGASGSTGQNTVDDTNIAVDTYNWNKTLNQAVITEPNASFILSAGDQVDYSTGSGDGYKIRESEYAGFLYPSVLRSLPIATTIGNHESLGDDYSLHYNNPNSEDNLGATASGSDYYFSYGDALIISLNSNNRNVEEHRELLQKAVESHEDAVWKIVIFHHDIYGSGQPHSDVDGANLRILFAPLMDEFDIDVCLTGHDHSYARTYQILDGTAIDYDGTDNVAENPDGTLYIAAGSASGSKFYELNTTKQYYIAERSNVQLPTFSVLRIDEDEFTIETYDYNGSKYADDFTITKNKEVDSDDLLAKVSAVDTSKYTTESVNALNAAVEEFEEALNHTEQDPALATLSTKYDNTINGTNPNDPLNYYAYATGEYAAASTVLKEGVSTLLDKTLYNNDDTANLISGEKYSELYANVENALNNLVLKSTATANNNQNNNNDNNNNSNNNEAESIAANENAPQTGVATSTAIFTVAGIMAALALLSLGFRKKEEK